ncbi:MAG: mechanosensitive ion channel family protein [Lachnospiraceae bacterium]|nr:mechanosensitive ion channel family protein [Lachnospiraceae bacterium]
MIEKFLEELPENAMRLGMRVLLALLVFFIGRQLIKIVRKVVKNALFKMHTDVGVCQFLDSFIKIGLYVVLLFSIASGFGLDAASILAVLGSAGVAIGLALQGSLSNLAGGVLILILKPFRVGDYIIEDTNKNEGTVTEIQIFYTKLTTVDNSIIVLPNGSLANASLTNISNNPDRRLDLKVRISYDSDLRLAKEALLQMLDEDMKVIREKERLVFAEELGESGVVLGIRCWLSKEDFWEGKWRLTETVKYCLEENGIRIAYPQREIYLASKTQEACNRESENL